MGFCPCHNDGATQGRRSLSVKDEGGKVLLYCFAGCKYEDIMDALGLKPEINAHKPKRVIVATYDYRDADGRVRYQAVRYHPKSFAQCQLNEAGGRVWNMKGVEPLPFRLPELLTAIEKGDPVFIVEGEKDVLNLAAIGITATCNHGGAGKWKRELSKHFPDSTEVAIFPDNDEPGRQHAEKVAQELHARGCRVRIANLENLPDKGDVSDWIAAGGTKDQLFELAALADLWVPTSQKVESPVSDGKNEFEINLTDLGNARRLVFRHGEDLRYCHTWGKWLVWDGIRWARDDTGAVMRRAKETVSSIYAEASAVIDPDERKKIAAHAIRSESERGLKAMVNLAASELKIAVTPAIFDQDPWLLNMLNGTVNLKTGELRPHQREDLITELAPVVYDAAAECPRWITFLDEMMDSNQNLVDFLQRAAGMSLAGDTSEHVLFVLHGAGRNGKSTFLNTLLAALGGYAIQAPPDLLLAKKNDRHPTELADLFRKRLVVSIESEQGRRLAEGLVKQLTGGDKIKARRMREDFWEFWPTHKLWLATNHKPQVRGTDVAIWSRLKLIPFSMQFLDGDPRQDKKLPEKLLVELPGILSWAVQGCLLWQRGGLGIPDEVRAATEEYREQADPLTDFLTDCCLINPLARAHNADIWKTYLNWAREGGEKHPVGRKRFTQEFVRRGFGQDRTGQARYWQGIGLIDHGRDGRAAAARNDVSQRKGEHR